MTDRNYLGYEWSRAEAELKQSGISYEVIETKAISRYFRLDSERLYIVRQTVEADGRYLFVVASKMRKEVLVVLLRNWFKRILWRESHRKIHIRKNVHNISFLECVPTDRKSVV